ncbi:MAG: hypothetical protein KDD04_06590, partial [Sinomicrobium sp.]|nr:hypothetical protein [Sinomicrobium sp.]
MVTQVSVSAGSGKETGIHPFLPQGYALPDRSKQFMKLEPGDNPVRILSGPVVGYVFFTEDKKPVRRPYDPDSRTLGDFTREELQKMNAKKNADGSFEGSRHFWMMLVWDRKTNSPKILEITQITIIKALYNLLEDKSWGDLRKFDINIHREGTGKFDTEFSVTPKPHQP